MNSFAVVFLAALACANAGLIAAPGARVLQGPSSSATIVGPDGSAISSIAPGGTVVADSQPGLVAAGSLVAAAPAVVSAPAVLARSSIVGPAALAAPAGIVAAPGLLARSAVLSDGLAGTVIAGPSGSITTGGSWAGLAAAPLTAAIW
ncbi:uncharacterized protein [Tenebrio molitor]|uniref:uncharacterized protein n=1 Tax=Tenebrio molitor TaxID=7067 RepID=UPI003624836C